MFYKDYVQPKIVYISTVFKNYLKKFDRDTIDFLYETYNVYLNLQNIQQEYFYPDGYHLNAKGHLILSGRIEEFMK
jgi:lysophospholipase L1-like esterase